MQGDSITLVNLSRRLEEASWIDQQTAAVFLEFAIFNANINLFQHCLFLFELTSGGNFINSARFYPINLLDINNSSLFSFKILINLFYLTFIAILMFHELKAIIKMRSAYFKQAYNYIDLSIIAFSWAAFSIFIYRLYASYDIYNQLGKQQQSFINFQYTSTCDILLSYFLGFAAFFASLRFIKILRFNKRVVVFLQAFKTSIGELSSFAVVFLITWLSFVQVFYLILNNETLQFSSFQKSMATCFQIILGKFNTESFIASKSSLTPFLFVAYNVIITFVLINIFVSILISNFDLARLDNQLDREDPEMFNYLKEKLFSLKYLFHENIKESNPKYREIMETVESRIDELINKIKLVI